MPQRMAKGDTIYYYYLIYKLVLSLVFKYLLLYILYILYTYLLDFDICSKRIAVI
jgi:hypothetical protein